MQIIYTAGDNSKDYPQVNTTQKKICQAFIELYARTPLELITIRQLCQSIPIARTTFYRYFDNVAQVEELLVDLSLSQVGQLMTLIAEFKNDNSNQVVQQMTNLLDANQGIWKLLLVTKRSSDYTRQVERIVKAALAGQKQASYLHAQFLCSVTMGFLIGILTDQFKFDKEALVELERSLRKLSA
ncbi:MAG: TetR/AcrR family transcriptional regulator [Lentilactobacillus diolivorans]|uniref:TetR/AcrR family transcriptional regulator n=1 Tax=Lentilactobacillus diolivorans TaxID=179838 RepID=UPI0039EC0A20